MRPGPDGRAGRDTIAARVDPTPQRTSDDGRLRIRELEAELARMQEALTFERRRASALRKAIEERPAVVPGALASAQLGLAHLEAGSPASALERFREVTELDPENPTGWVLRARASRRLADFEEAGEALVEAQALAPKDPLVVAEAGELAADRRDVAELRRIVAGLGGRRSMLRNAVRWAQAVGDDDLIEHTTSALLARVPDSETALLAAAKLRWRREGPEPARALLAGDTASLRRLRLQLELDAGDADRAVELLRREPPDDLRDRQRAAWALVRRGWLRDAAEILSTVHADPESEGWSTRPLDEAEGRLAVTDGEWRPPRPHHDHDPVPGRVLHVIARSEPHVASGHAVRTRYTMLAQRDMGLDPVAVTKVGFPPVGATGVDEDVDGLTYHRLSPGHIPPARLDRMLDDNLVELDGLCDRVHPAVLHAHTDYPNALLALELRERRATPVIYEVRGFWEESWLTKQPDADAAMASDYYQGYQAVELDCMLRADRVVTLAEVMRRHLLSRGVPDEQIVVVPNAVDAESFRPEPADPALLRRLGLDDVDCVLGYITSIRPLEGIEHLVRAAALLQDRGHRVGLLVVGDGPGTNDLMALARDLGLGARAVFPGRVPHTEILRYYGAIDVFVVPRPPDRVSRLVTPLKPFEALATGKALVVSDVEALREIVDEGTTGLVFRAGDHESLADVVEPLLSDPAARARLGAAGREWVSTERTWRRNGERYRELMADLGVVGATA